MPNAVEVDVTFGAANQTLLERLNDSARNWSFSDS